MAKTFALGIEGVLQIQTDGVSGSAGWVEVDDASGVTVSLTKGSADVTTRGGSGYRQKAATLKEASVDGKVLFNPVDTSQTIVRALLASYDSGDPVGVRALTGDPAVLGTIGIEADMGVFDFSLGQENEEGQTFTLKLEPTPSATPPVIYDGSAIIGA